MGLVIKPKNNWRDDERPHVAMPILLYGTEAWPTNAAVRHSLDFACNQILFKIFGALSKDTYRDICDYFGISPIEEQISVR